MWQIDFSKQARKFFEKHGGLEQEILGLIRIFILKLQGEIVNIDIKKLKGEWKDYFRIRKGKLRILLKIDFDNRELFVEKIDFRGDVYK